MFALEVKEVGVLEFRGPWGLSPCKLRRDGGRTLDLKELLSGVFANISGKLVEERITESGYELVVNESSATKLSYWLGGRAFLIDTKTREVRTLVLPSVLATNNNKRVEVEIHDSWFAIRP